MEKFKIPFLTFHLTLFIKNKKNKKILKCLYSSHTMTFKNLMKDSMI